MVYLHWPSNKNLRFCGGFNPSTGVTRGGDSTLAWKNGWKTSLSDWKWPPFCREHMLVLGVYISHNRSRKQLISLSCSLLRVKHGPSTSFQSLNIMSHNSWAPNKSSQLPVCAHRWAHTYTTVLVESLPKTQMILVLNRWPQKLENNQNNNIRFN